MNGYFLPISLSPIGLPGCNLYTSSQLAIPTITGASGMSAGLASIDLPCKLSTAAGSIPVYGQWLSMASSSRFGALSDAVEWSFK